MSLKPKINRELLKQKIGDQNIFLFYFGPFELNKSYKSIFRQDDNPSTGFFVNANESLIYNDFTTGEKYDFVHFVMKLFNLNYYKALERIAIDFELIPGERSTVKPAIFEQRKPLKKQEKILRVGVVRMQKHHLEYWKQYGITEEELKANHIYAVNNLYINDYNIPTKPEELRFAYLFKDGEKEYLKIYSPYDEQFKWVSSVSLNIPFGLADLSCTHDTLIITKSVKDCLVLRKFFPDVIGLQNESKDALKKETIKALNKCYKRVIVWFDQDKTGIFAANWYKEHHGFIPVFTPKSAYNKHKVKDPSDFVKQYGLETFEQYLKHIKLL